MCASHTIDQRAAIVRLFSKCENARDIQKRWKDHLDKTPPHLASISLISKRFNENGTVDDLSHSDRPTIFSEGKLGETVERVTALTYNCLHVKMLLNLK